MKALANRLARLEAGRSLGLSEAAKAWLGMRPPLSDSEKAAHEAASRPVDLSGWSPELRKWLGLWGKEKGRT